MSLESHEITLLLNQLKNGNTEAGQQLIEVVYPELRRIAESYMRNERPEHTLQPTALVNEAFLKLAGQEVDWQDRAHFFGLAAKLMRRVLVEYARIRGAQKRGGGGQRAALNDEVISSQEQSEEVLALDEALDALAEVEARQSRIVELRYFGGLSVPETAAVLGISEKTVKRDWALARVWLRRKISGLKNDPV